jgi:hypothetical protein
VLDYREHARRDEPRCADHSARARHLTNLYGRARAADFNRPARFGRFDDVLARGARPGVHQDLYKITFSHAIFMPKLMAL